MPKNPNFFGAIYEIYIHVSTGLTIYAFMSFYLYLLLGFLGGLPAGMGMGGGTVTIPLLVLFGGVEQKLAQSANLFAFLPMSALALKTHNDNGFLQAKGTGSIILFALATSFFGVTLASYLPSEILKKIFGLFLIGLSVFSFKKVVFKIKEGER